MGFSKLFLFYIKIFSMKQTLSRINKKRKNFFVLLYKLLEIRQKTTI